MCVMCSIVCHVCDPYVAEFIANLHCLLLLIVLAIALLAEDCLLLVCEDR